ncbi:basic helix-loop-helix protein [Yamadazyma tenuis]|uniref:BHLH domain-containing protein n=1 Tax=Candida tenuis (strain ATCC 10573 / BCRC 21748 / CBS 615 / JCM 9827 / NBRC 10315 / NRRL Y-1498 / VKM Y-70) TaxID=590646 RepID=G3BCE3_CANTC|nr:uncharacterized protein CANTEDRAFT_116880 [Yamadazyma tenuis ATCC 10573]XP_006690481.1 uncharacterized protein CANTEDRAFT_116880 [Yamadazyma tenuis ATCC 10573]EGV61266.1 hypothetical protein CANTEDRAFT_116880 [Yamadazyma tenuis ATCC 10573]EGV61267.1 hypothetical protein CANTEDRAFT_116880 [Yamadazyma tenuis ATCC 10573]WEJ93918.1 basic helix-loop-helix protein [Yamadazyma tenuis]
MSKRPSEQDPDPEKKFKHDNVESVGNNGHVDDGNGDGDGDGDSGNGNESTSSSTSASTSSPHQSAPKQASQTDISLTASSALSALQATSPPVPTTLPPASKPEHGSDEWHRLRKESHKEVERRRRENINGGIRELAGLIPTSDTNKAQILQRAIEYIKRLKENETNNIEKWTLEKLLTEQAVSELDASNTKLKQELERAYREIEQLKRELSNE